MLSRARVKNFLSRSLVPGFAKGANKQKLSYLHVLLKRIDEKGPHVLSKTAAHALKDSNDMFVSNGYNFNWILELDARELADFIKEWVAEINIELAGIEVKKGVVDQYKPRKWELKPDPNGGEKWVRNKTSQAQESANEDWGYPRTRFWHEYGSLHSPGRHYGTSKSWRGTDISDQTWKNLQAIKYRYQSLANAKVTHWYSETYAYVAKKAEDAEKLAKEAQRNVEGGLEKWAATKRLSQAMALDHVTKSVANFQKVHGGRAQGGLEGGNEALVLYQIYTLAKNVKTIVTGLNEEEAVASLDWSKPKDAVKGVYETVNPPYTIAKNVYQGVEALSCLLLALKHYCQHENLEDADLRSLSTRMGLTAMETNSRDAVMRTVGQAHASNLPNTMKLAPTSRARGLGARAKEYEKQEQALTKSLSKLLAALESRKLGPEIEQALATASQFGDSVPGTQVEDSSDSGGEDSKFYKLRQQAQQLTRSMFLRLLKVFRSLLQQVKQAWAVVKGKIADFVSRMHKAGMRLNKEFEAARKTAESIMAQLEDVSSRSISLRANMMNQIVHRRGHTRLVLRKAPKSDPRAQVPEDDPALA
tara:strand:- start:626 stop:2392 length:1767 start_codon:yes stop_codon:yes gene_type:complete